MDGSRGVPLMGGATEGDRGSGHPHLENPKLPYVPLEVLVRTPLEKQLSREARTALCD